MLRSRHLDELSMSNECLSNYIKLIHEITGIVLLEERKDMLIGRLNKRIRATGASSYREYFSLVTKNLEEKLSFIDAITTNETRFFRTPQVWDYIEQQFLPKFYNRNEVKKLRVWSAAASSGEEALSIGMICNEFKKNNQNFEFEITGTDISPAMISKCQRGHYQGQSIEKLKQHYFKHFSTNMESIGPEKYQVIPEIKERLSFRLHNLFERLKNPRNKFHLILLRNVMIYFSREDQKRVLRNISCSLVKGGTLVIGESESIVSLTNDFEYISPRIYRLKEEVICVSQ